MEDPDRNDRGFIRNRLLLRIDDFTPADKAFLGRALTLAEEVHQGHTRKPPASDPEATRRFIVHPMRVGLILIEEMGIKNRDVIAAGLLHDVVEDSQWQLTTHDLEQRFGRNVALFVSIVTRPALDKTIPVEQQRATFYGRIGKANVYARIIKLSERLDNMRDLLDCNDLEFQKSYLLETWNVFLPIALECDPYLHGELLSTCQQLEPRLMLGLGKTE